MLGGRVGVGTEAGSRGRARKTAVRRSSDGVKSIRTGVKLPTASCMMIRLSYPKRSMKLPTECRMMITVSYLLTLSLTLATECRMRIITLTHLLAASVKLPTECRMMNTTRVNLRPRAVHTAGMAPLASSTALVTVGLHMNPQPQPCVAMTPSSEAMSGEGLSAASRPACQEPERPRCTESPMLPIEQLQRSLRIP